jgi:urease accessory protein
MSMLMAEKALAAGEWKGDAADVAVLGLAARQGGAEVIETVNGLRIARAFGERVALRGGDAIQLADGRVVEIVAAAEPLIEIRAENPEILLRLALECGNRHVPVQIVSGRLRVARSANIEKLAEAAGAKTRLIEAPFDPEGAAYLARGAHAAHADGHDHHHHGHDHATHHDHHDGCGCGHDHHNDHHAHHHHHGHKHG